MAGIPRLNGVITALMSGAPAFATFCSADSESSIALAQSDFDAVIFELEHGAYDVRALRDSLQYMLNRRQILEQASPAPVVTPMVRIPPNGVERNSWVAKQVLDLGVYGVVWPHIGDVEEARNAVAACRYPRPAHAPRHDPPGLRGDAPFAAARYWGLTPPEYYARADVWPLAPEGEILVILMIEEVRAIENLPRILEEVPGIGAILIGEGDLSQELGVPRQYDHPAVREALTTIVRICQEHDVACGHPHVTADNVERLLHEGFRLLMPAPTRSYAGLERGRQLSGRA